MLAAAIRIHEYMSNFMLSRCVIGFSGTVNWSAVTHAWALSEGRAVGSISLRTEERCVWMGRCVTLPGSPATAPGPFPGSRGSTGIFPINTAEPAAAAGSGRLPNPDPRSRALS